MEDVEGAAATVGGHRRWGDALLGGDEEGTERGCGSSHNVVKTTIA